MFVHTRKETAITAKMIRDTALNNDELSKCVCARVCACALLCACVRACTLVLRACVARVCVCVRGARLRVRLTVCAPRWHSLVCLLFVRCVWWLFGGCA